MSQDFTITELQVDLLFRNQKCDRCCFENDPEECIQHKCQPMEREDGKCVVFIKSKKQ